MGVTRVMEHPRLDVLKYRPLPELASALRAAKRDILETWQRKVVDILPSADELTLKQLQDHVPGLLDHIAAALASDRPQQTDDLIHSSPQHGETRFHQNFNLNELLIEYHLLRSTMFAKCAQKLGRPLEVLEIIELNSGVDVALRTAAVNFAEQQAEGLKSEAESFTKYLSFLSHDIRGGLNGVLLMVEVLKRELSNEPKFSESVADLDAMRRSMLDTVATMDRFLSAERLRRGKMPVTLAPVHLPSLLHDVIKTFSYQAKERGLHLQVDAPEHCNITSDRDLLSLILQNLLSNAVKYSSKGSVKLAARCGALTLQRRAKAELAAIGVRPRTTHNTGVDSLTPSERRAVELAATGGTNREIAQTLFVTEKTVETHLGRAFRKLDISSRRQLPDVLAGAAG